jgi:hypothetical protein
MQRYKIITALILLLPATTAPAQGLLSQLDRDQNNYTFINAILSVHFIIHKFYGVSFIEEDFLGTSEKAPCSDLKSIGLTSYSFTGSIFTSNYDNVIAYDSVGIEEEFGKGLTCIKTNVIWNNQTFSTGNIELIWDKSEYAYVAANPDRATIDFVDESDS